MHKLHVITVTTELRSSDGSVPKCLLANGTVCTTVTGTKNRTADGGRQQTAESSRAAEESKNAFVDTARQQRRQSLSVLRTYLIYG